MKKLFGKNESGLRTTSTKKVKVEQTSSNTVKDKEGNVIHHEEDVVFTSVKNSQPRYFQTYFDDSDALNCVTKQENNVIKKLAKLADFETSIIYLHSSQKKQIVEDLGIVLKTVDNIIQNLKAKQVLFSLDKGVFILNPFYFGKGSWDDQLQLRKAIKVTKKRDEPYKFDASALKEAYKDLLKSSVENSDKEKAEEIDKERNDNKTAANENNKKDALGFIELLKTVFFRSKKHPTFTEAVANQQKENTYSLDNSQNLH
ncbi:hypothetical protein [Thalassotalea sp. PLHSN55]|uniref:hypothetical protein n=1 Tax=Thalassotalea sp. PLHSN55 TaxID=3435888 RepID=UPI003F856526